MEGDMTLNVLGQPDIVRIKPRYEWCSRGIESSQHGCHLAPVLTLLDKSEAAGSTSIKMCANDIG
jgi:hypothetical protein